MDGATQSPRYECELCFRHTLKVAPVAPICKWAPRPWEWEVNSRQISLCLCFQLMKWVALLHGPAKCDDSFGLDSLLVEVPLDLVCPHCLLYRAKIQLSARSTEIELHRKPLNKLGITDRLEKYFDLPPTTNIVYFLL